jgi:hypothetical protein
MDDRFDVEFTDPWGSDGQPEEKSVLELIKECKKEYRDNGQGTLAQAQLSERWIRGEQYTMVDSSFTIVDDDTWPEYAPKAPRNLLRNLSLTWSSRVVEDRPWVQAYPSEPGVDQQKAQVASRVLEYVRQTHDFDDFCFRSAELVQPHTCVGWKVVWDPLAGPPSKGVPVVQNGVPVYGPDGEEVLEGVGEPQGDVAWQIVSIFDYGTDGSEEIEDARYCWFTRMMSPYDARHLLETAGLEPRVEVEEYRTTWGDKRKGVEVCEFWHRPDFRFPKGLYAIVVGEKVVQAIPFPYEHGELPLCVWKCSSKRDSPFGTTHVDDAIPIQRSINEAVSALQQQARILAGIKLIAHPEIINAINNGHQMIPIADPEAAKFARYLEPPPRSEVLVQTLDDNIQALYAIYGLNEILTGAENAKSGTSAKSIAYLNKLDSMKMSGAARSLSKCILRLCRQTLKLYQQYVQAPRLMQIAGEGAPSIEEFLGAELQGIDVVIEPSSALSQLRGEVSGAAQAQIDAGNPNPALGETVKTGIQDTAFAKASRDSVRAQVEAALNGEPQQADQEIDAQLAVQEIAAYMPQIQQHPNFGQVQMLLQGYQSKVNQMMSAMNPQQGAPQQ